MFLIDQTCQNSAILAERNSIYILVVETFILFDSPERAALHMYNRGTGIVVPFRVTSSHQDPRSQDVPLEKVVRAAPKLVVNGLPSRTKKLTKSVHNVVHIIERPRRLGAPRVT